MYGVVLELLGPCVADFRTVFVLLIRCLTLGLFLGGPGPPVPVISDRFWGSRGVWAGSRINMFDSFQQAATHVLGTPSRLMCRVSLSASPLDLHWDARGHRLLVLPSHGKGFDTETP